MREIAVSSASKRNLKLFFKRHNRLFTLLGAFIVFATFVVKEGLRDYYKDLETDVSEANGVFAIRAGQHGDADGI
jgi:hypothetical protein